MKQAVINPFALALDFTSGKLEPATTHITRHLSHMRNMYIDSAAEQAVLTREDPLIYEVYQYDVPNENGQLISCTTILYPGRIGDEYYMTKGHYHEKADTGEIYLGLRGNGKLLMQVGDQFSALDMGPGTVAYVPPYWAHRTVNTGDEPFIFFAVYPADAGHNYGTIEQEGFQQIILEKQGNPVIVPSPRWKNA